MNPPFPTSMATNGAAPNTAASLYVGEVMHARLKPVSHRFVYRVASLLIDLDRLEEAKHQSAFFSVNRFNLFSFHEKDHGPRDGSSLRKHVDTILAGAGLPPPPRVLLLCYPRVLGYVFNPLSVYFVLDEWARPQALLYEVCNTFGEHHTYVAPIRADEISIAGIRQSRDKRFYVSPFMPMKQRYHFRILPPGRGVRLRILETDDEGPILAASFSGLQRPLCNRELLGIFSLMPLHTLKVFAGIHYEALRLYLKKIPLFTRGAPPPPTSYGDAGAGE